QARRARRRGLSFSCPRADRKAARPGALRGDGRAWRPSGPGPGGLVGVAHEGRCVLRGKSVHRSHTPDAPELTGREAARRVSLAVVAGGNPLLARPSSGVLARPRGGCDATEASAAGDATEDAPLTQGLGGDRTARRERLPGTEGGPSFRVRDPQPRWRGQRRLGGILLSVGRFAPSVPRGRRAPSRRGPQRGREVGEGFASLMPRPPRP